MNSNKIYFVCLPVSYQIHFRRASLMKNHRKIHLLTIMEKFEHLHTNEAFGPLIFIFIVSEITFKMKLYPNELKQLHLLVHSGPLTQSIQTLQNELINIITMNPTFESIDIHPIEELHLSLTRTTILRHHWIDEFVRSVQNNFKNVSRLLFSPFLDQFIPFKYLLHRLNINELFHCFIGFGFL